VGVWKGAADLEQARRSERRFEPSMDEGERQRLYEGWRDAVARVLSDKSDGDG